MPNPGNDATTYLAGGVLYVNPLYVGKSFVAYNAQTGRLLWTADLQDYETFFDLPITSGLLFAPGSYNGVVYIAGLDARTGHVAWQVPFQCVELATSNCGPEWSTIINGKLYLLGEDNTYVSTLMTSTFTLKT